MSERPQTNLNSELYPLTPTFKKVHSTALLLPKESLATLQCSTEMLSNLTPPKIVQAQLRGHVPDAGQRAAGLRLHRRTLAIPPEQ